MNPLSHPVSLFSTYTIAWGVLGHFVSFPLFSPPAPTTLPAPQLLAFLCYRSLGKSQGALDAEGGGRGEKRGNVEAMGIPRGTGGGTGDKWGVCGLRWGACSEVGGAHLQVPVYNVFLVTVVHSRYDLEGTEEKVSYLWSQTPRPLSDLTNLPTTKTQGPRPPPGRGRDAGASRSNSITAGNAMGPVQTHIPAQTPGHPQIPRHPPGRALGTRTSQLVPSRLSHLETHIRTLHIPVDRHWAPTQPVQPHQGVWTVEDQHPGSNPFPQQSQTHASGPWHLLATPLHTGPTLAPTRLTPAHLHQSTPTPGRLHAHGHPDLRPQTPSARGQGRRSQSCPQP